MQAGLLLLALVLTGVILVMILNPGFVNHLLTPVFQYISLFAILWDDNPWGALKFLLNKSLLAFAYKDPRSGLNLWTLEFDSITTLTYITVALVAAWIIQSCQPRKLRDPAAIFGLVGMGLIAFSVSYMTSIAHCSGPTWVGFVSLYGLGFDEFELYPAYQISCAALGLALLGTALYKMFTPAVRS